ncbi:MAG: polysaccharide pyruvyl transferase family protein [Calditrichaceae bacterium]|nr:polysaccharide pyruvyl transferase family protein [Calditrichaceae bacterium]MBN2707479.1 polysaccharide pyruvyl transferase family protein [Calditrichaceae bacterium]
MKIYHLKINNFGDALNNWLWPKLIPNFFDNDENNLFIGIGTVLNAWLPQTPYKIVLGAGAGGKKPFPLINEKFRLYALRGPISARLLNVNTKFGIGDGAILLKSLKYQPVHKEFTFSFMPHVASKRFWNWKEICDELLITYIDPEDKIEKIIESIRKTQYLITSALHGAIVADLFRVPQIHVYSYKKWLNKIKWEDWCLSVKLKYNAVEIGPLYSRDSINEKIYRELDKNKVFPILNPMIGNISKKLINSFYSFGMNYNKEKVLNTFRWIVKNNPSIMSKDEDINNIHEQLQEKLFKFKKDFSITG